MDHSFFDEKTGFIRQSTKLDQNFVRRLHTTFYEWPRIFQSKTTQIDLSAQPKDQEAWCIPFRFRNPSAIYKKGQSGDEPCLSVLDCITGIHASIRKRSSNDKTLLEFLTLTRLRHENIIDLVYCYREDVDGDHNLDFYVILGNHGASLRDVARSNFINKDQISFIAFQIFTALDHLHASGLIHRDISPDSILVNEECRVKLTNLPHVQIATPLHEKVPKASVYLGDRSYRAPEQVLEETKYDEKIDIWAAGCCIVDLLIGRPLFDFSNIRSHVEAHIFHIREIFKICGLPDKEMVDLYQVVDSSFFTAVVFEKNQNKDDFQTLDFEKWLKVETIRYISQHVLKQGSQTKANTEQIREQLLENFHMHCDLEVFALLSSLFVLNPRLRPASKEILKHTYFRDQPAESSTPPNKIEDMPEILNSTCIQSLRQNIIGAVEQEKTSLMSATLGDLPLL